MSSTKIKSDGGSTSYYNLPEGARDIGDLIEYRGMSFGVGNIFKACFRLGRKEGNDDEYDLRKIIFFAERELEYVRQRKAKEAQAAQPYCQGLGGQEVPAAGDYLLLTEKEARRILGA